MPKCRFQTTVFILATLGSVLLAHPSHAQTFVVSAQSWDAVKADSSYLLQLFGLGEGAGQKFDEFVRETTGVKSLAWLNSRKPFGLYADLPEDIGTMPAFTIFIPITDEKAFLGALPGLTLYKDKKEVEGIYLVEVSPSLKFYLRLANKHAYFSNKIEGVRGVLRDPATMELGTRPGRPLAASFRFDRVSNDYKEFVTAGLRLLATAAKPSAGESDAEYKARMTLIRHALTDLTRLLNEMREITLYFEIDRERKQLVLEAALIPEKNSRLAQQIKNLASTGTRFGILGQDSVASLGLRIPFPDEWQTVLSNFFMGLLEPEISKVLNLKDKAMSRRLLKVFEPTLKAGYVDFGIALQGPKPDGTCVLVGGLKIEEGKKVEQLFRDFLRDQPADLQGRFTRDFATHRTTRIHKLGDGRTLLENPTDSFEHLMGANLFFVSIRDDIILFSGGKHSLQVMKDTLDGVDRESVPDLVRLDCSLYKLFAVLMNVYETPENRKNMEPVRKVLAAADKNRDRLILRLQGGDMLRLKLTMDSDIVQTAGAIFRVLPFNDEKPPSK